MKNEELMGNRVRVWKIYQRTRKYTGYYLAQKASLEEKDAIEVFKGYPIGWIVGFRSIPDFDLNYEEGWPVINPTGGRKVALVSLTPMSKPYYVPMDGFEVMR